MDLFNTNIWLPFPVVDSARAEDSMYKRFARDLRVKKTQFKPSLAKVNIGKSFYLPGQLFTNL